LNQAAQVFHGPANTGIPPIDNEWWKCYVIMVSPPRPLFGKADACDSDYNTACWNQAELGFLPRPWKEADPCCATALTFSCLEPRPGNSTRERKSSTWLSDLRRRGLCE